MYLLTYDSTLKFRPGIVFKYKISSTRTSGVSRMEIFLRVLHFATNAIIPPPDNLSQASRLTCSKYLKEPIVLKRFLSSTERFPKDIDLMFGNILCIFLTFSMSTFVHPVMDNVCKLSHSDIPSNAACVRAVQ